MAGSSQLERRVAELEAAARTAGWLPATRTLADAATLEGHSASYFAVAGATPALAENTAAPPAASLAYAGTFYLQRSASGQPSQLLFCGQTSTDGVYEWGIVWQSS